MNMTELSECLVENEVCETKSRARSTIGFIFDQISKELQTGSEVTIPGFGKFSTATQAGRSGAMKNKGTGEEISWTSEAKQVPKFKAGKALKDLVAN